MAITFTKVGTPDVVVTINKNPAYPSPWRPVRLNQFAQTTADGTMKVYDGGPNVILGTINLKNVVKSEGDALRTFLQNTVIFQLNDFTITPPANTDIGGGAGVALTACKYEGGQDLGEVFEFIPPGKYNISLPYRKVV